jgi:hypothetical protein
MPFAKGQDLRPVLQEGAAPIHNARIPKCSLMFLFGFVALSRHGWKGAVCRDPQDDLAAWADGQAPKSAIGRDSHQPPRGFWSIRG